MLKSLLTNKEVIITAASEVVFTRVCHSVQGGGSPAPYPGGKLRGLAGGGLQAIPRGEVEGGGGSPGPYPGRKLWVAGGSQGPYPIGGG